MAEARSTRSAVRGFSGPLHLYFFACRVTLRLIVFMGAATCAALTLGGGARLAGLL
ncbi:hypothetical protein [Streptomyces avermitilis]|uniref:hypothetical protein n=1 Tax=Streptomyces avermitilis TaxID=33903 RepID=UPI0033D559E5